MNERFVKFSRDLAARVRTARFGDVPVLLAHPDWSSRAPVTIWLHGRTSSKEIDSGRYLRWIRAGIAACAIDLPGHGERFEESMQGPGATLDVIERALGELSGVLAALGGAEYAPCFDLARAALGGMSLGGMITLRRLCEAHKFRCAAVEATCGWLGGLYFPEKHGLGGSSRWPVGHDERRVRRFDPAEHLEAFRPMPLLALHSEADQLVPVAPQREFIGRLWAHYESRGASPELVRFTTWEKTGAPQEHIGFGNFSNDAKNLQTEFLVQNLKRSV